LAPFEDKFKTFNWKVETADGHNMETLLGVLNVLKEDKSDSPKVLIADTIKGKGAPQLESDSLCHIKSLKEDEINVLLRGLE
jgi:transketolase